jgi:hypothetical protein
MILLVGSGWPSVVWILLGVGMGIWVACIFVGGDRFGVHNIYIYIYIYIYIMMLCVGEEECLLRRYHVGFGSIGTLL